MARSLERGEVQPGHKYKTLVLVDTLYPEGVRWLREFLGPEPDLKPYYGSLMGHRYRAALLLGADSYLTKLRRERGAEKADEIWREIYGQVLTKVVPENGSFKDFNPREHVRLM